MTLNKVVSFAIGPIGAAALGLITLPFIAWFFSVEDVGRLTMLQVILRLSVIVLSLQLHQAYVREYHEVDDKENLLKAAALPSLIALSLLFIVLWSSPISIPLILFGLDKAYLTALLFIGFAAMLLINLLAHLLRMQERGLAFSATQFMPKLTLLVLIGLIVTLNLNANFELLMLINITAVASSASIFLWLTRKDCLAAIRKSFDKTLTHSMLSFSLPLVAGALAYWGLTAMDRFFLRSMSGFDELGVYAMAASLAGGVSVISTIFSNLWHPVVYRWVKEGIDPDKVQKVIDLMTIAVAFIWCLVGSFSWVLVYFLPPEYNSIEYLIIACAAMPLFKVLSETTVIGIGISRKSRFAMLASLSAFVVNALLNYILIPEYGASGAAIASVIAFFIFFAIRTEASAHLWHSIPRSKTYIVSVLYVLATIYAVSTQSTSEISILFWPALFILTLVFFKKRFLEAASLSTRYLGLK